MRFTAKLRKIGNSLGVIIPKNVITSYKIGSEIELNVITSGQKEETKEKKVITQEPPKERSRSVKWCSKHDSFKCTCGCK